MNNHILGVSALALTIAFSSGANSLSNSAPNPTSYDSDLPMPLAYFNVKAGERHFDVKSQLDAPTTNTTEPYRPRAFYYQHGQKPISIYRNRAQKKANTEQQKPVRQTISKVIF